MNNSPEPIVSRPFGGARVMLVIMLCFCLGTALLVIFDPPKPDEVWMMWINGGVPGVAALGLMLYLARHRVIADENGLRWRGAFTGWKSAHWNEITDFTISSWSKTGKNYAVETARGELTFSDSHDTCADELAAIIAARATQTPFREWGAKGLRENETFERVFTPPTVSGRVFGLTFVVFTLIIAALIASTSLGSFGVAATGQAAPYFWWQWGALLMPSALIGALLAVITGPFVSAHWLGERERIVASQRGLRFEARGRALEIAWHELRAVHLLASRARFETARGDWQSHWIAGLRPIIERHAPDVPLDSEANGTDLAFPVKRSNGTTFYPFRTETVRLGLMLSIALVVPMFITFFVQILTPDWGWNNDWSPAFISAPYALANVWLWRIYRRGGVALSENGLEVRGAWRDRFYRWDEIVESDDKFVVRRGEKRVKLWFLDSTVRRDEVRAEVARRLGQEQPRRAG